MPDKCEEIGKRLKELEDAKKSDFLIAEYNAAVSFYNNTANFTWIIACVLIAAGFVLWGFMINSGSLCPLQRKVVIIAICIFIWVIATVWYLFAKMQRIHLHHALAVLLDIEKEFNFQNRALFRWNSKLEKFHGIFRYKFWFKGKFLELVIYLTLISGGPIIYYLIYDNELNTTLDSLKYMYYSSCHTWGLLWIIILMVLIIVIVHFINNCQNKQNKKSDDSTTKNFINVKLKKYGMPNNFDEWWEKVSKIKDDKANNNNNSHNPHNSQ